MREGFAIAVIIPALDEQATLPGVLKRIPVWVDRVVVVDNGSTDQTAAVARAAGVSVVVEPNRGYGRACLRGIAHACGDPNTQPDILVFLDADGSDVPEQMERLVDPIVLGWADMVVGSRTRGHCARGAMTWPQRFGNVLAPALIRWIWGQRFTDLGPFRAVRLPVLRTLRMDDQTYGWTVQMQIRAARAGVRVFEVPVDYGCRRGGRSKISGSVRGAVKAGSKILSCVAREYFHPPKLDTSRGEALAVFAKFPQPGKVKTRLIPALGAEGAAAVHEQMVRHTLDRVGELRRARAVETSIFCAGTQPARFASHFGTDLPCVAQTDGDLGQRMHAAFGHMLREAMSAVIIGTDCPDLSSGLISMAFDALRASDLVLGPARDGGYYLIGLRRPVPSLFENMDWSTSTVLASTIERASSLGLCVHLLPTLSDVDEPQDLAGWERVRAALAPVGEQPVLSVIVPTLDEASRIGALIDAVRLPGVEIIVVDGGSSDSTRDVASAHGARVVIAARGRGSQLNAGAALARGRCLLFLHADTILPKDFPKIVQDTLADPGVSVGAFRFRLDRRSVRFRCVEAAVGLRCRLFAMPYGDQALFMRRETFAKLRGFASIPLMEDVDLVRRARSIGRVRVVDAPAVTSARRWELTGVMRMTAINQACVLGYAMGVAPQRLASWRNRLSGRQPRRGSVDMPPACQIVPEGSGAPSAARAICMAGSDLEMRK